MTTTRLGISMPMLNVGYRKIPELAELADATGFDSLWDYEFYKNPFVAHALNATRTTRIKLATGIATAASRTPFEMANAAADVDELSHGRMVLGIAPGGGGWTDVFNGVTLDRPLPRMRDYVANVRAVWNH